MSKVNVYSLNGEVLRTEALPEVFSTAYRPDVIHRPWSPRSPTRGSPTVRSLAPVSALGVHLGQGPRCGPCPEAGPGSQGCRVPPTSWRSPRPPAPGREDLDHEGQPEGEDPRQALRAAATADEEKVRARGHRFNEGLTLPVVVEDRLEDVKSTSEVLDTLKSIGVSDDVIRAKDGIRIRAGRGKMRGRPYRMPRSLLIVVSAHDAAVVKGARNLPGVEVAFAEMLNPGHLAPGGMPGRLTVFTESALKKIGEW